MNIQFSLFLKKDSRVSVTLLRQQAQKVFGENVELAEDFKTFQINRS